MSPVSLFRGVRPIRREEVLNDVLAGITLAALGIPEVMGYTKIAETPVVAGLYTLLLPVVAFAVLGASRIIGFGDSAILAATLVTVAVPRSPEYVALTALVVLVVAVMLLLAYFFRLALLADFLSRSALMAC